MKKQTTNTIIKIISFFEKYFNFVFGDKNMLMLVNNVYFRQSYLDLSK